MIRNKLLLEYSQVLIGNSVEFSTAFHKSLSEREKERNALQIFTYAIEIYLGYSPKEAAMKLSPAVIKQMKLEVPLSYIEFPTELNKTNDLDYIVNKIYPKDYKIDDIEMVHRYYKQIINGNIDNFKKKYFVEGDGRNKALICLSYALQYRGGGYTIEEMYEAFSQTDSNNLCMDIKKFLADCKLMGACKSCFDSPLEFFHLSLPDFQQNMFLYHFFLFKKQSRHFSNALKKLGSYKYV